MYVPSLNNRTKRAVVKDLDKAYYPTKVLVPNCDIVHDRSSIELFRGWRQRLQILSSGVLLPSDKRAQRRYVGEAGVRAYGQHGV